MVKKETPLSAIRRAACICFSQEKQADKTSKKNNKRRNGHSFIPIFNEPSSIEKILEDAERQALLVKPPPPPPSSSQEMASQSPKSHFPQTGTLPSSPPRIVDDQIPTKVVSSSLTKTQAANRVDDQVSPKLFSSSLITIQAANRVGDQVPPKVVSSSLTNIHAAKRGEDQVPPKVVSASLTHIQAATGGSYVDNQVPLKVVSSATVIQASYRGYVARRAYKALKGLVRLQGVTKSEGVKKQIMNAMKTMQSFSKLQTEIRLLRIQILESKALQRQTQLISSNNNSESVLSKQSTQSNEWDDSMMSKQEREARLEKKREAILLREKAISYAACTQQQQQQLNHHPNSHHLPWWWNWIDHKLPFVVPHTNNNYSSSGHPLPLKKDKLQGVSPSRYYYPRSRPTSSSTVARSFNDDSNSLVSCPAFSSPRRHYMEHTASARAKVRPKSNPRQRMIPSRCRSPAGTESSRRFSFPATPTSGSSKFNRESFEQQTGGLHNKMDQLSMGSPTSVTSRNIQFDRKPFNRFV